jgi:GWxTD domain-containing protein
MLFLHVRHHALFGVNGFVFLLVMVGYAAPSSAMQRVSQAAPESVGFRQGVEAFDAGRYQEAIAHFETQGRDHAPSQYYLARVFDVLDDEPNATRSINRAIELDRTNMLYREWQHRIGSRAFRIIQKARERDMLRDMLALDPDNAYANTARAAERTLIYQHHRDRIRLPELTPFESLLETNRETYRRQVVDDKDVPDAPEQPATHNPFDIEEMRQRGYNVQDLGFRADSAFTEALQRLTHVLEREPGYREAYRPLMALLSAAGDATTMRYWATTMHVLYPDDPDAWRYLGYAAHRLGQSDDADRAFRKALNLLPVEERVAYTDLRRVMNEASDALAATDSSFSSDGFWAGRDPLFLSDANERELEHYARLVYADLQFTEEKLNMRGWDSDRGRVYVRYGPPRAMYYLSNSVASCSGRTTSGNLSSISNFHIFEYPEYRFVFGNAGNFADAQNVIIPPLNEFTLYAPCSDAFNAMRSTAADFDYVIKTRNTIRETPEAYTFEPVGRRVFFPHLASAFKGEDGQAEMYVSYGIPLAVGPRDESLKLGVEAGAFLVSNPGGVIARRRHHIAEVPGTQVYNFEGASLWIGVLSLDATPGRHTLAVEFESATQGALGMERSEIDIPRFDSPDLHLSDVQLAYLVEESDLPEPESTSSFDRLGYRIQPSPWGVFGVEQPLYIYFEMYNLGLSAEGRSRYQVEAMLVAKSEEGRLSQLFRRTFRRSGGGDGGVSVRFDGAGSASDEGQYFILDASTQPPGTYVLALRVKDLETGDTSERRRTMILE